PKPAAVPAKPGGKDTTSITSTSIIDTSVKGEIVHIVVGALVGLVLCLGLATVTGDYLIGAIFGIVLGGVSGAMVGDWPAAKTTGD
ncbi:MAG TPA: hypothetical protein VGE07_18660, partial [Herpetosiphonaceae bacterium]